MVSTLRPAPTRSESTSRSARRDPSSEPAETENPNQNDNEAVLGDPLRDTQEWLQEFKENLVDERVPAHRDAPASSSRESASQPQRVLELTSRRTETATFA